MATRRLYIKILSRHGLIAFLWLDPSAGRSLRYLYLYAGLVEGQVFPYAISRIADRVRGAIPKDWVPGGPDRELICVYADVDEQQPLWAVGAEDNKRTVGIRSGTGELVTGPDQLAEYNPDLSADERTVTECLSLDEATMGAFLRAFGGDQTLTS